jgi:hypothetical protein
MGNEEHVLSVLSASVGVSDADGQLSVLLPKDTILPASAERVYEASSRLSTAVDVPVCQGCHPVADQNTLLVRTHFVAVTPLREGGAMVRVRVEVDVDGSLNVTTTDVTSGTRGTCSATVTSIVHHRTPDRLLGGIPEPAVDIDVPESWRATWTQALKTRRGLTGHEYDELGRLIDAFSDALSTGDEGKLDAAGCELMDALFDLMV